MKVAVALLIAVGVCGMQTSQGANLRALDRVESEFFPSFSLNSLQTITPPTASPSINVVSATKGLYAGYLKLKSKQLNDAAKAQFLVWTKKVIEELTSLQTNNLSKVLQISMAKSYAAKIMTLMQKSGNAVLIQAEEASTAAKALAIIEAASDYELSLAADAYVAQFSELMSDQSAAIDIIIDMTASVADLKSAISRSSSN